MKFRFKCRSCSEWHEDEASFSAEAPAYYYDVPPKERERRCTLGSDDCVIDEKFFFIRACLEVPIHGETGCLLWGVWVSLSRESFKQFARHFDASKRSHVGPFFGWLSTAIPVYPDTLNLKTRVHIRDDGLRPLVELQSSDHPLALEQHDGIPADRLAEILTVFQHQDH